MAISKNEWKRVGVVVGGLLICRKPRWEDYGLLHLDDDLALGAAGLDIGHRLVGLVEREDAIDHGAYRAFLQQARDLAELAAVGMHEEERVVDSAALGPATDSGTQQAHH